MSAVRQQGVGRSMAGARSEHLRGSAKGSGFLLMLREHKQVFRRRLACEGEGKRPVGEKSQHGAESRTPQALCQV